MPDASIDTPAAAELAHDRLHDGFRALRDALAGEIVGQAALVDRLLTALLADGHLLVEGAPGLAKTTAIRALAARLEADFSRVQFTPDLLPADLTGTEIWRPQEGRFEFVPGPIFHPILLADEINRAPAKVQSALLEAMGERQVTVGRHTYALPALFLVMATQNPIEQEGTFPLPEAQLDRFLMHVRIGYPDSDAEAEILRLARERARDALGTAPPAPARMPLQDVFDAASTWSELPAFAESVDADTATAILEEAARLSAEVIAPLNRSGDEEGATWQDGEVGTPAGFKEAYRTYAEGGWVGIAGNPEFGGQGMPKMLTVHLDEMLYAANCSFALYPALSSGACLALDAHGDEALKRRYLPAMYSGRWAGTMCLTEAQAGSDLGLIRTRAQPRGDGSYAISGSKIFITGGEHDLSENIIHLVLARMPDAPAGAKGLSLFLVPKVLLAEDGSLGPRNAMGCGSIEHKMGIKASATCVLNFDGATGWLVGEAHRGLAAMFTMMNYERLSIGIQGLGCAEASYQTALAYARERLQGRAVDGGKDAAAPIIVHSDVRRMLLSMRAMTEGGRALATYVGEQLDIAKHATDPQRRQRASRKVALLTPVAKAFFTDTGLDSTVLGQQVLGGHGYVREWGQEQLVRDVRIAQIYEGTNAIQALDLLGRKVLADGGETLSEFLAEILEHVAQPGVEHAAALRDAVALLQDQLGWMIDRSAQDPREIGAGAVEFLHLVGYVTYAWLWSKMATAAVAHASEDPDFHQAKRATGEFFFRRLLPRISGLSACLRGGAEALHTLPDELF